MTRRPIPLSTRRARLAAWLLPLALAGCGGPAPYQTFSPGTVIPLAVGPNNLPIYNASTTTPDADMSQSDAPAAFAIAPATAAPTEPTTPAVAICYSRIWNKPEAVKSAAVQACGTGVARLVSQDNNLDSCTLLSPTRAVYACTGGP